MGKCSMLDQHYRQCLDEPIPMLGDKTPRQRVKNNAGREKVVEWLKYLENNELRRASAEGEEPNDSSWMWGELKPSVNQRRMSKLRSFLALQY